MKQLHSITIGICLVGICGTAFPQTTFALYRNNTTGKYSIDKLDATGSVTSRIVIGGNRGTEIDRATSVVVGPPALGGVVEVAMIRPEGELLIYGFAADGSLVSWDTRAVLSGVNRVIGYGQFAPDLPTGKVIFQSAVNRYYTTFGRITLLDISGVNQGTFTDPIGVCDADGDGDPDIILQDPLTRQVKAMYFAGRTAVGIDADPWQVPIGLQGSWTGVSDVDGNGSADLFISRPNRDTKLIFTQGNAYLSDKRLLGDRFREMIAFGHG